MRPIKFRVWDKEEREMFWLDLTWGNHHSAGQGWLMAVPWGEEYRHADGFRADNRKCLNPEDCEFMQFTGLLDKEGKEIWEGDVVKSASFYLGDSFTKEGEGTVVWNDGSFMVNGLHNKDNWNELDNANIYNYDIEVIGNVWEHPEALK